MCDRRSCRFLSLFSVFLLVAGWTWICEAQAACRRFDNIDQLLALCSTVRIRTRSGRVQPSARDTYKAAYERKCIKLSPPNEREKEDWVHRTMVYDNSDETDSNRNTREYARRKVEGKLNPPYEYWMNEKLWRRLGWHGQWNKEHN